MRFLVASLRAELLPLAHRLRREGHEVEALVWRARYEAAWEGALTKSVRHSDGTLEIAALETRLREADRVLTTVRRVQELCPTAYGVAPKLTEVEPRDRLLLGGWFSGEEIQAPHLLVADWGVYPGGLGAHVLGGLTLVKLGTGGETTPNAKQPYPAFVGGSVQAAIERMKSASFRGLFHFDVEEDVTSGELRLRGLSCGWPELHTFAFVAELANLASTISGEIPKLQHKYVSAVPVSVPPWPSERQGKGESLPIEGLTPTQQGKLFWLDMQVDGRQLRTAGLDGLVAVAIGASDSTPALARLRALELAGKLSVDGKQVRPDAGLAVDSVLASLEDRYGFVA